MWTNGCFDILHRGHIELLTYAHSLGDFLFVGVDTDEKVRRDKGTGRPINCLADRIAVLRSLSSVDGTFAFDSPEKLSWLLKTIHPNIMVVGTDYKDKPVIGSKFTDRLVFFDKIPQYSSTNIINYINNIS